MLGLLLALSLAGTDDGIMCVGVPSNPKFTSVNAPTGNFQFVDAGTVQSNRLDVRDVAGAGITVGPSSNSSINFSGSLLACGNGSAGLSMCNESGALSIYSGSTRKLLINPNTSFSVTDPVVSLGGTFRGVSTSGSAVDLSTGIAQLVTGSGAAGILCTNATATCAATGVLSASSAFLANSAAVFKTTNNSTSVSNACGFNTGDECNFSNAIGATAATTSVAAFKFYHTNGALDATDLLCDFGDNSASKFKVDATGNGTFAGSLATTREFVVDKVSSGIGAGALLATGTNYSGWKFPQAWTLTHMSINVTTASTATVANTVLTTTDGTNTCTFTFACNTDSNTTGVKDKAGVNGAGTGCVYAAGALVTLSVTTQGCATAITTNSITTWGKPQ